MSITILKPSPISFRDLYKPSSSDSSETEYESAKKSEEDFKFKSIEQLENKWQEFTTKKSGLSNTSLDGFKLIENWTSFINIPARILKAEGDLVSCECLMDQEAMIFEQRVFPQILFGHINVSSGQFVLISIKSKVGSSRVDVYNGTTFFDVEIFDKKAFEIKDKWDVIDKSGLDSPFEYVPS